MSLHILNYGYESKGRVVKNISPSVARTFTRNGLVREGFGRNTYSCRTTATVCLWGRTTYIQTGGGFTNQWEHSLRVQPQQVQEMMTYLCQYSRYAYARQMKNGYLTLDGGIRVGVAGEAIWDDHQFLGVEHPMFLNIRIPREYPGCASWAMPYLLSENRVYHTLILAPPRGGKTTLLRDLLRQISNYDDIGSVAILDERFEIAACHRGIPTNDVGIHSDVYSGYDKAVACMQAIRTMGPEWLLWTRLADRRRDRSYLMLCAAESL